MSNPKLNNAKVELKDLYKDIAATFAAGLSFLNNAKYKKAKEAFNLAVRLDPRLQAKIYLAYEKAIKNNLNNSQLRLSLADFLLSSNQLELAVVELEEIIEMDPKNSQVYNILGNIFVKKGRIDESIRLLENAIRNNVKDVVLSEILASAYLEKNKTAEATELYKEILKNNPEEKRILRILGELHTRLGNFIQAAEYYALMFSNDPEVSKEVCLRLEDLNQKDPENNKIKEVLADIYARALRPGEASNKYLEVLNQNPDRIDEVLSKYRRMLKNYPDHPETVVNLSAILIKKKEYCEAVENLAKLVKAESEYLAMVICKLEEIVNLCPEQILARQTLANAYIYDGEIDKALMQFRYIAKHDTESKDALLKKVKEIISSHPESLLSYQVLGEIYLAKGELRYAINTAEEMISMNRNYAPAYLIQGEAYTGLRLSKKAKESIITAMQLDPNNSETHEKYKEYFLKEIDVEIINIKNKIKEDPWRIALHLDLGKLYLQKNERNLAIKEIQIAVKDQTRAVFAYNLLGIIFKQEGRFDLAAFQFLKALEVMPSELSEMRKNINLNLASTYEALGQLMRAISIYEEILKEDIGFADLENKLKNLKSTKLDDLRNKKIMMMVKDYDSNEFIGIWGKESRSRGRSLRKAELNLSFGQTHNNSGFEFYMKGMLENAREEFSLSVGIDNNFTAAINNLAVIMTSEGLYDDALSRLQTAENLEENTVIMNNLGVVCYLKRHLDAAEMHLRRAIEKEKNNVIAINLADVLCLKGKHGEAINLYKNIGTFDMFKDVAERRLQYKIL